MAEQYMFMFDAKPNVPCPHCGHVKRVWRKKIISTAAASLVRLVALYRGQHLHLDKFNVLPKDRNFNQLVLWGLAEPMVNRDTKKRASGMWQPTQKGIDFVYRKITLPKYINTQENRVLGFEGPQVDIIETLGQHFDYFVLLAENK